MGKKLWWRSAVAGIALALKSWMFWILAAGAYIAFTADWVIGKFGKAVGWLLLVCLLAMCLYTILKVYTRKRNDSQRLMNHYRGKNKQ